MPQQYVDFAFVKANASFEAVLAHYNLKATGSGKERAVLCPFHKERKPSCKIDLERNIFHCFGCEAKGNILEFVARLEGDEDELRAAAMKIAELCDIALASPRESRGQPRPAARRQRRTRATKAWSDDTAPPRASRKPDDDALANDNDNSAEPDNAPINPPLTFELKLDPAHSYLKERGLSTAAVREFGLGHCARGVMAGRICIPIHDTMGQLVAYAGRWPGEDVPEGEERYKLPKNFQKRRVLFNLHRVPQGEHVVLVEGYWSAIRLHMLGLPAVALMGWSVAPEQVALLRDRGVQFVTLLLDGDDTGRRGRDQVVPELAAVFFVRAPLLPDGEKPDTLPERALREVVDIG